MFSSLTEKQWTWTLKTVAFILSLRTTLMMECILSAYGYIDNSQNLYDLISNSIDEIAEIIMINSMERFVH